MRLVGRRERGTLRQCSVPSSSHASSLPIIPAADPTVWIRFKKDFFEARAQVLGPDERPAAWGMITTRTPAFADYQEKTEREIPVVRLTRVG